MSYDLEHSCGVFGILGHPEVAHRLQIVDEVLQLGGGALADLAEGQGGSRLVVIEDRQDIPPLGTPLRIPEIEVARILGPEGEPLVLFLELHPGVAPVEGEEEAEREEERDAGDEQGGLPQLLYVAPIEEQEQDRPQRGGQDDQAQERKVGHRLTGFPPGGGSGAGRRPRS